MDCLLLHIFSCGRGGIHCIHVEIEFGKNSKAKHIHAHQENSIPLCQANPLARVHMENFHLTGLAHFSYEHIMFFLEFLKEGQISPR